MYILEGNIGAGKSTFLRLIQNQLLDVAVGYEPLADWQKQVFGQSLLTNFYADPSRWAYAMETFAMLSRAREHIKDQEFLENRIIERSIYSGHYCFALNSYRNGYMLPLEWNMYNAWFNFLIPGKCRPPQGFIYLRVNPEIAHERIKKRSREGESLIPLSYLEQLHECHEDFLLKKKEILPELKTVPVLTLDCNQDFESDKDSFERLAKDVQTFLHETNSSLKVKHEQRLSSF
jgi:deoxyadenosine/deoxycytidine kinase